MPFKKKPEDKAKQRYKDACWYGYCPGLAERENSRIKELANRLKADSKKETLTNISEWQNNNIAYWFERYPLSNILFVFIAAFLISLFPSYILGVWWIVAFFGIASATLLAVTILMITYYRKISLRHFFNIISRNLSADFLLEKKLAICRDYAKLSANLLFNIYPETNVYFVHARSHVATGIIVENRLYILDKYLPVATIDKWHEKWNKGKFSPKKVEKAIEARMERVSLNSLLSKMNPPELDTDILANKLERILSIQSTKRYSEQRSLKILEWKNGAILYEDDEIVNYSLAQRLKSLISKEALRLSHIAGITINRRKDDLVFHVVLK